MIFKFHYGLWYGALVGIIPFMFNYCAEYADASGTQHGILYTILPFVALLAKPVIGSLADSYAAHHHCLLFFIFTTMLGFGSLAIYPFFPVWVSQHKNTVWVLYCIAAFVGNTSMCVVNSIGDSLAINSSTRKNINYGEYRLWGPVGFGFFGAIWGIGNQIPALPKYTPGIITLVMILMVQIIMLAFWYDKDEFKILSPSHYCHHSNTDNSEDSIDRASAYRYGSMHRNKLQLNKEGDNQEALNIQVSNQASSESRPFIGRMQLLLKLGREKRSVFIYIFIFAFCGLMTGIHWQFFFKYLLTMAQEKKQNFSLITTLALPVQALGGELVFFKLSGKILQKIGAPMTLVVCLFSFATRYLLYAYFVPHVNLYWILMVELFQGPAFGLMYCVLTHQANVYSEKIDEIVARDVNSDDLMLKKSLHATLQGILGASFEGLGLGLGAIAGGRAYDTDPILMWQIAGYAAFVMSTLYLIGILYSKNLTCSPTRSAEIEI